MHIPDIPQKSLGNNYSVALDFADWLTRVRYLSIHGGFECVSASDRAGKMGDSRTWSILRRMMAKFEDLEQMALNREGWGLYLPPIVNWLACPKLKTLQIHGISERKPGPLELEPEKCRTASFTSLRISDYEETPGATSLLLQWPAILTHFEFGSFYNNPHTMDYPMFERWLLPHQHSLKHIDIGYLSRKGSSRLFNAKLFPNLEFLQLSRWQMHSDPVQFLSEHSNVLGPSLKTFAWDFSIYDQHSEGWCDFGEAEANWVRELAECAVSRKSALATIKIQFTPNSCWGTTEDMGYPWDRMDTVRDRTLAPNGLDLVYNKPSISKDAWLEYIRTEEADSDANDTLVDDTAQNEQSSAADEQVNTDILGSEVQRDYQGEDIRGYFIGKSNAS
ncbi:hypothetical protein EK21DRAFT_60360 [Setomelanomma holmii]|uniref:Uncharacterized protein n=1 Tax=Setomelanomma holmii TaxID=210430 RepID=A0A9P4HGA2_9PLEO|nr:hypothetical protein EK21DRAFT_60360 [Setomelanomma holmii]